MTPVAPRATDVPSWLPDAATRLAGDLLSEGRVPAAPDSGAREAAVLVLLADLGSRDPAGAGVVLTLRSSGLRSHAGQVSFPGGRAEPHDPDPARTALREASEEVGLAAAGVDVVAMLPALHVVPSNHAVTPVLAWWREPSPLVPDGVEVDAVDVVPLRVLADPANRWASTHPLTTVAWPVFQVPEGFLVWGFTAWVVDRLIAAVGLDHGWDRGRTITIDELLARGRPS